MKQSERKDTGAIYNQARLTRHRWHWWGQGLTTWVEEREQRNFFSPTCTWIKPFKCTLIGICTSVLILLVNRPLQCCEIFSNRATTPTEVLMCYVFIFISYFLFFYYVKAQKFTVHCANAIKELWFPSTYCLHGNINIHCSKYGYAASRILLYSCRLLFLL